MEGTWADLRFYREPFDTQRLNVILAWNKQFLAHFRHLIPISKVKSKLGQTEADVCTHSRTSKLCLNAPRQILHGIVALLRRSGCGSSSSNPELSRLEKSEWQTTKAQTLAFCKQTPHSPYVCGVIVTSCGQSRLVSSTDRLFIPTGARHEDLPGERMKAELETEKFQPSLI